MPKQQTPKPTPLDEAQVRGALGKMHDAMDAFQDARYEFAKLIFDAGYQDKAAFAEAIESIDGLVREANEGRTAINFGERSVVDLFRWFRNPVVQHRRRK
ncbi:MAG: hypothetical protein U0804_08915 [Gemmataceae bacterium]